MVEETLKNSEDSIITIAQLKRELPKQINHNTLKEILDYLQELNRIYVSVKGITYIYNPSPKLQKAIDEGYEI